MNIIIAGDGQVGSSLTQQLSREGYDVTLIDNNPAVLSASVERYDVLGVQGNCASMDVLRDAGVWDADLLIAATSADEINLLCCTTAHAMNPNLHTIARIRNPEYIEQIYEMRDTFGLSMVINPERQAAMEIERLLKFPGFLGRDSFANGRTEIVELKITPDSKFCNVSLIQMSGIVKCKVLVCAVLRNGQAITPGGDFVLKAGDRIFVTAPTENLAILLKSLGIITRRVRDVILCGGGKISFYLASLLDRSGISVRIIESDLNRCRQLCELLPNVGVVHGDAADQDLMESENITGTDAVVTLTDLDEMNMIVSLYATAQKVPQVITKLGSMVKHGIMDTLDLGSVICPKELCCNSIVRYVRAMQNQTGAAVSLHTIADGRSEAVEFLVESNAPYCGVPLKDLKLKPNVLIVSITHGSQTEIPNGNSQFQEGDTLVVVTSGRGILRRFDDIFA